MVPHTVARTDRLQAELKEKGQTFLDEKSSGVMQKKKRKGIWTLIFTTASKVRLTEDPPSPLL
jgi:hypothetical protein